MNTDRELMQQTLEVLEQVAEYFNADSTEAKTIAALRERLAQPEQEPVAWDNCRSEKQCRSWCGNSACGSHWSDTTPPQRKPLTDEEILSIARDHYNPHQRAEISFARAIEAAHGIKGEQHG